MKLIFQIALGVAFGIILGFYIREQRKKINKKISQQLGKIAGLFGYIQYLLDKYTKELVFLIISYYILEDFLSTFFIDSFKEISAADSVWVSIFAIYFTIAFVLHIIQGLFGRAFTYAHNIHIDYGSSKDNGFGGDYFKFCLYGIFYVDILSLMLWLDGKFKPLNDFFGYLFLFYYFASMSYRFLRVKIFKSSNNKKINGFF